jgi:hypothetical protein
MKSDIVAYLIVLNYQPVLDQLTPEEYEAGRQKMLGCLHRVEAILGEQDLHLVKYRERLNGMYPVGHPGLQRATEECAKALYEKMRAVDASFGNLPKQT